MLRKFYNLVLILTVSVWASTAFAAEHVDRIIDWLRGQGFTQFEVERTWLGRTKIEAHADGLERELIINTRTGEILRDYWEIEDVVKAEKFLIFVNPYATVRDESGSGTITLFEYHDDDGHDEHDEHDEHDDDHHDSDDSDDEVDSDDEHDESDEHDEVDEHDD